MSNRFSFDGAGASQTTSTGGSTATGGAVRLVSTAGAAGASQDARQERAAALGGDAGGGGGGGAGGKYVPAHLRNGGGRASAGAGAGSRGGFGGGRGGGGAGGRGGYGGAQQGGYAGGSRPNSRGGGDFGSFGGRNAGGFGGFGGQQQARPQGGRFDMGGGGAPAPAPAARWPGLDGLDDFEDKLVEDQAAFLQKFGEPRSSGIDFAKYDKIDVEVKDSVPGKPALPTAQKTFAALKLGKVLSRNLSFNKYEVPTPVQQHAIPIATCGRDIMACAQTGSGKTLAFMLPICWHLLKRGAPPVPQDRRVPISALGLAPTRELAVQIHDESQKFAFRSGLRFAIAYGGTHVNEQIRAIERGCDVLIATPGRLVDMLERGTITLRHVIFLVLDEADRMLDMGFEPQMRQVCLSRMVFSYMTRSEQPPPCLGRSSLHSADVAVVDVPDYPGHGYADGGGRSTHNDVLCNFPDLNPAFGRRLPVRACARYGGEGRRGVCQCHADCHECRGRHETEGPLRSVDKQSGPHLDLRGNEAKCGHARVCSAGPEISCDVHPR